jgi:hypothetical protein
LINKLNGTNGYSRLLILEKEREADSRVWENSMIKRQVINLADSDPGGAKSVTLKWSEILESAFEYYKADYIPAWALNQTHLNNSGDKLFISKKSKEWVSWEKIDKSERPDIATLFDLLPDLPEDGQYKRLISELADEGVRDPEDHFWENMFSYKSAKDLFVNGTRYRIDWEA